jgi:hypothetical protein
LEGQDASVARPFECPNLRKEIIACLVRRET